VNENDNGQLSLRCCIKTQLRSPPSWVEHPLSDAQETKAQKLGTFFSSGQCEYIHV
jgi:hypothetical protein